jgi:hypothetical protein
VAPLDAARNVPLAPLQGAVKVTVAPETGLPWVSVTSGFVNAVATVVDWLAPDDRTMVVAVPAVLFRSS